MSDRPSLSPLRAAPVLLLAAVAACVFFFRLGERGFENRDTIWYVEIAWEMLRSGDWIVPRFNGVIFTEKPVLFIWLVAASAKIAGGITPFVSRLPSALAAFGCVFLTHAVGKKMIGRRAALLAGFVLCTNYAFAWEARTCMVDMVFTFLVTLALSLLYCGFSNEARRGRWFVLAYFAVGLAALTKGPLGVAFPSLVSLAYLAWRRRLGLLREMRIPWGILIVLGIQAAWYGPYLARIGADGRRFFWEMYVYKENLLRFTSGFDKPEPFWFYVPEFFAHFLPWSALFVLLPFIPRLDGAARPSDRTFPAAWFLSLFALLTLSTGKHSRYALPLYPAAALLAGDAWERMAGAGAGGMRRAVSRAVAIVAAGGAAGLPFFAWYAAPAFFASSLVLSAVLLASSAAVFGARPEEKSAAAFVAVAVAFCCFWVLFIASLPAYDARRAEHERLALQLSPATGAARLATYGLFSRRLALGFFMGRVVEYLGDEEHGDAERLSAYLRSGGAIFCLLDADEYGRLRATLPPHRAAPGRYRYRKLDLVLIRPGAGPDPGVGGP